MNNAAATKILLVEDNKSDVYLFRAAAEEVRAQIALHEVENGEEALDFLRQAKTYEDAPRPDVVVLDLNMPVMSGQEMLAVMMAEPEINQIPVAVLTTSAADQCVCKMCPPGHCIYFTKGDFESLKQAVQQILGHARKVNCA